MSLTAKDNGDKYPIIGEGIYPAVCTKIIDLGSQYNTTFNNTNQKIRIFWELPDLTVDVNGETVARQISKDFTNSLNEKANLRSVLQSWRGKAFTPEELQGFDLKKVVGAGCQLQVIHKASEKGLYANIQTVMALPQSIPAPKASSTAFFDMDDPTTYGVFETLPQYVQEKIARAENFADTGLVLSKPANGAAVSNGFHEITDDGELPF